MKKQLCAWKKRITAFALVFALLLSMVPAPTSSAAKKVSLSKKKLTIKVGKSKKLKLKNNKKKVKWKVVSGKKKIKLKAKKKTSVKIVAKKKGKAKVQAKVGKKKYTCKITVKGKSTSTSGNNNTPGTQTSGDPNASADVTASGQPGQTTQEPGSSSEPGQSTQTPGGSEPGQSTQNPGGSEPGQSTQNPGGNVPGQTTQTPGSSQQPSQPTQDPTQSSGGDVDLGGKTAFNFGSKKLALGISRAEVLTAIGSATRTEKSPQGFDVIVYNPGGYNGYTLIYLKNDVVVSLCAVGTAGTVSYGNLVKTGDAASTLTAAKGWTGEPWFTAKENDNAAKDGEGAYRCTDSNMNATVLAYVDCYKRNQVYCIQAFSNTMSMEEMTSSSKCKYDTEILNAIKLETAELLIAYRIACGYSATQYPLKVVDGLATVAQDYLNKCPTGSDNPPGEQDATALKAAVLAQNGNDVPLYFAQITMAGNSDSIGFANCILERKEMSEYIAKLSYLEYSPAGKPYKYWYQYIGIAASADGGGHSYMVIDLVDRWYNSDPRWYGSDDDDDGWE